MTILGIIFIAAAALALVYWFLLHMVWAEAPTATEVHTIQTKDGWKIKLYHSHRGTNIGEPIFFCHGFTANAFNFTYPRNASIVDYLAAKGYDCWVIDLRGNRSSVPPIGISRHNANFADHYNSDIPAALDYIRETTGYDQVHWVGHSMGGMLLYAFTAVHGTKRIASGTTLASPPGFKESNTADVGPLLDLAAAFPFFFERLLRAIIPLAHLEFRERSPMPVNAKNLAPGILYYNAVEMPPSGVLKNMDDWAYRRTWVLDDRTDMDAYLPTMDFPLHLVASAEDRLAPPNAIIDLFHQLPGRDKQLTVLSLAHGASANYNHIDIPFGIHAATDLFQPVADWLARHSFPRAHDPKEPSVLSAEVQAQFRELESDAPESADTEDTHKDSAAYRKSAPKTGGKDSALWGKALENASTILESLDETKRPARKKKSAARKKPATQKKTATTKKKPAAKKKTATKKPAAKKSSPKKKASTKAKAKKTTAKKKTTTKKKPTAKKKTTKK